MTVDSPILEGLVSGQSLDACYRKRRVKYLYRRLIKQDLQPYFDEGWERTPLRSKTHVRLRRLKDVWAGFEDEVWCTFWRMGFQEMNRDSNFSIVRHATNIRKQVDVFAKDDQCVCILECKSAEKPHTRRSLDKDIDQMNAIRHDVELSVLSHYQSLGVDSKPKIIWLFALKNIDISSTDLERAQQAGIKILDSRTVDYYSKLSNHFGRSAKYQFLADTLAGKTIPDLIEPVPAMKGKMGKAVFYSFVMEPEKLLKIAYIAHRGKTNEESAETYQRMVRKSRLQRIAEYIHNKEGIFPTNVVVNFQTGRKLRFDPAPGMGGRNAVLGTLHIPSQYKTAWIIDGQHRLFAYSDLEEARTATLPVIAFENLDANTQAQLFVDINGEQVKVPKQLLSDLWATIHWNSTSPSEQLKALTSRLVKELSEHRLSPLRDRIIRIEGGKTRTRSVTMVALTDEIQKRKLLGSVGSNRAKTITPGPLFVDDLGSTLIRAREVISGYLDTYVGNSKKLARQWEIGSGEGGYICTNQGLVALLRVLYAILEHLKHVEHHDISKAKSSELIQLIREYQEPVCQFFDRASPKTIQDFRSQYGEGGFRATTFSLLNEIHERHPKFQPPGLFEWVESRLHAEDNPRAYDLVCDIEVETMSYVTKRLRDTFGNDISQWWHKGVPEKSRTHAMGKAQNAGEYHCPERFLEFIDWKEIIHKNFDLCGEVFTMEAKPNDSRKKKLEWFEKVNEIRRIVAHPPRGVVNDSQLEYLTLRHSELIPRLKAQVQ